MQGLLASWGLGWMSARREAHARHLLSSPSNSPTSPCPAAAQGLPSSSWRILAFSDAMCSAHVALASSLRYVSSRVFQSGSTVTTLWPSSSMLDSHDSHCNRTHGYAAGTAHLHLQCACANPGRGCQLPKKVKGGGGVGLQDIADGVIQ